MEHYLTVVPEEGGPGVVDRGEVALDHGLEPGIGGLTRPRRGREQPLDLAGIDEQPDHCPFGQPFLNRLEFR